MTFESSSGRGFRYRTEVLDAAAALCRERLNENGRDGKALQVFGLLASRAREHAFAEICLTRATVERPSDGRCHAALGDAALRRGDAVEAIRAYLRALTLEPEAAAVYAGLGRGLQTRGLFREAEAAYREALRLGARPSTVPQLADVLLRRGRASEAVALVEEELRLNENDVNIHCRLGKLFLASGEWSRALEAFRRGLRIRHDLVELQVGTGMALIRLGALDQAVGAFRAALNLQPTHLEATRQLVFVLERAGVSDDVVGAWLTLAATLERHRRFEEAGAAYRAALSRKPECLVALNGVARLLLRQRDAPAAIQLLEAALKADPDSRHAHNLLAGAAHLSGDRERGWREQAWSHRHHSTKPRAFEQPQWDGGRLDGRTVLVWTDRGLGLGDAIQLVRYLEPLRQLAGRVVVECHPVMVTALSRVRGVDAVVANGAPLPAFDVHTPYPSLPHLLGGGTRATRIPYIVADRRAIERWRQRLRRDGRKMMIGLCWGGTPTHREAPYKFLPLAAFAPLGELPGIRVISLQLGPQAEQALVPPLGLKIERVLAERCTIADSAALIGHLELVVTVDTMIAHLAGALGKPVWLLIPHACDARWMDGEMTPWYPTMRIFRQPRPGDWAKPLACLWAALQEIIQQKEHCGPPRLPTLPGQD